MLRRSNATRTRMRRICSARHGDRSTAGKIVGRNSDLSAVAKRPAYAQGFGGHASQSAEASAKAEGAFRRSENGSVGARFPLFPRYAPGERATLAKRRALLLTCAGLSPAGSHQLVLAHRCRKLRRRFDVKLPGRPDRDQYFMYRSSPPAGNRRLAGTYLSDAGDCALLFQEDSSSWTWPQGFVPGLQLPIGTPLGRAVRPFFVQFRAASINLLSQAGTFRTSAGLSGESGPGEPSLPPNIDESLGAWPQGFPPAPSPWCHGFFPRRQSSRGTPTVGSMRLCVSQSCVASVFSDAPTKSRHPTASVTSRTMCFPQVATSCCLQLIA
jgi:hypothetical protein